MKPLIKLADEPEHLMIILNKEEREMLNYLIEDKFKWCQTHLHRAPELDAVMKVLIDIEHKLNSTTPSPD